MLIEIRSSKLNMKIFDVRDRDYKKKQQTICEVFAIMAVLKSRK